MKKKLFAALLRGRQKCSGMEWNFSVNGQKTSTFPFLQEAQQYKLRSSKLNKTYFLTFRIMALCFKNTHLPQHNMHVWKLPQVKRGDPLCKIIRITAKLHIQ